MNASQVVVLNTVVTYIRSVLAAGLSLFSSRWVLQSLGASDYGLFALVGSVVVFIVFLNEVMAASASRFYAFEIGRANGEAVNKWFNTALSIHVILPILLILIGYPIGEYLIRYVLSIIPERIDASLWVFRISLISAFFCMSSVPFTAMFIAKQKMIEPSILGIISSILTFIAAYILLSITGDKLIYYTCFVVSITVLVNLVQTVRAQFLFDECRINMSYWFDKERFMKLFSYSSWNLIGSSAVTIRMQGSTILLNLFFGTKVNAAFGISNQVSSQTNILSNALIGALSPEIISSEGRGNRSRMLDLSLRASKLSSLLVIIFAIPLILEMDYVLLLWLKNPPEYSVLFCQLMLFATLFENATTGQMIAVRAKGKMAFYQIVVGGIMLLTIPLAWLFLELSAPPTSVGWATVIVLFCCAWARVFCANKLVGLSVKRWTKDVFVSSMLLCTVASIPFLFISQLPTSFERLLLTTASSLLIILFCGWHFVLDKNERAFFLNGITQLVGKVKSLV